MKPVDIRNIIKIAPSSFSKQIEELKDLYEVFRNKWAVELIEDLSIKVCPFCNREYIFKFEDVQKSEARIISTLDHFYDKDTYPFLAMSFYNLIPSCPICNHTKSSKSAENLVNPYDIKYDDFKFTYKLNDISFSQIESKKYGMDSFEIELYGNEANIEVFKLVELYKQHKDIVVDLLMKKAYYPKSYIEELEKNFGFTKDEIYRFLLCNYKNKEDLHKRPLSKLIKDISEELELL